MLSEDESRSHLSSALDALGVALEGSVLVKVVDYWRVVFAANGHLNLVSRRCGFEEGLILHAADSLAGLRAGLEDVPLSYLDFGSGGGFPGFVLKLARPSWQAVLADATARKARFLEKVAVAFDLYGFNVLPYFIGPGGRTESVFRGLFDLVTARAVDSLQGIARKVGPLVKPGGRLLAYKGPGWKDDLDKGKKALLRAGMELESADEFELPVIGAARALLLFRRKA
jgi:16S rRNA (guanine527-N7)-methyltransferase